MTPEERAEAITASQDGMDAIRHCDAFAIERMIADAIRAAVLVERLACAEIAASHFDTGCNGLYIADQIRARKTP